MTPHSILIKYLAFFEARGHKRIPNSPLVPENDPTTLFTSAGMQPLIPYLLGESHPEGKRLTNVQNCFRAQDIDEIGDNRHTTFFRMLGNWSLGDYFKKEEIQWVWEFLTQELRLPKDKLFITVYKGDKDVPFDSESKNIWEKIFEKEGIEPNPSAGSGQRIFEDSTNWWSRSGPPANMPVGEPGGLDTEVYFRFDDVKHNKNCDGDDPTKCVCGKFLEIANSVFLQYKKTEQGIEELEQKNVDFGGGYERMLAAVENEPDVFKTSLFTPITESIEKVSNKKYPSASSGHDEEIKKSFRIITDHLRSAVYIAGSGITPSNKEQGYILRRLIRRSLDNLYKLEGKEIEPIIEAIVEISKDTDEFLVENYETIKNILLSEQQAYGSMLSEARKYISKRYPTEVTEEGELGDELKGQIEISADDAFMLYSTHGLSPTQIKSLGYAFDEDEFAKKMKEHSQISRKGAGKKFAGGLADHSENVIRGHTATHLLHKAIRDLLGEDVHQKGSNITPDRLRFDFNWGEKLTDDQIKKLEDTVNKKIEENLEVFYEFMPITKAREIGAIGIFDEKYEGEVKIYMIGSKDPDKAYSIEFCGGPHVDFTGDVKSFKIIKQENIGHGLRRLYAVVG